MQPEMTKSGDNYQHGVIRLRGRVGRACPEHDVADTREGSRRFRVRVNIYLVRVFTFIFIFVSFHSPLFLLLFLVIFFYSFKF